MSKKKNNLGEITTIYPAEKEVKKDKKSKADSLKNMKNKKKTSIDFFVESLISSGILPKDYKESSTYYFAKGFHKHEIINSFQTGYGVAIDAEDCQWIITDEHYYIETFE
jgi:hypothetical protein